jgi:hypothetical protein
VGAYQFTRFAIMMVRILMIFEIIFIVKVFVTIRAEVVPVRLPEVLTKLLVRVVVFIASETHIMPTRVTPVGAVSVE